MNYEYSVALSKNYKRVAKSLTWMFLRSSRVYVFDYSEYFNKIYKTELIQ